MNLRLILKDAVCNYCNEVISGCYCPKMAGKGIISSVSERATTFKKWTTAVYGKVSLGDYQTIKKVLGTGGTYSEESCTFRGRLSRKVIEQLKKLGYRFEAELR